MVRQAMERMRVISLTPQEYFETIRDMADRSLSGGMTYDALLMRCAAKAEAETIYTLNARHFRIIAPDLAQRIVEP
jgi:predicted nucleic acid-binding protein